MGVALGTLMAEHCTKVWQASIRYKGNGIAGSTPAACVLLSTHWASRGFQYTMDLGD